MSEPGRTKAYHIDLRWRIVWQRFSNKCGIKEIAAMLCVSISTVWRILDRFQRTGDVSASKATSRIIDFMNMTSWCLLSLCLISHPPICMRFNLVCFRSLVQMHLLLQYAAH